VSFKANLLVEAGLSWRVAAMLGFVFFDSVWNRGGRLGILLQQLSVVLAD
jgi:hypothetical protein